MKGMGLQRRERERERLEELKGSQKRLVSSDKGGEHLQRQEGFTAACHTEGLASGSPGRKA